jgi:hypothetical protein
MDDVGGCGGKLGPQLSYSEAELLWTFAGISLDSLLQHLVFILRHCCILEEVREWSFMADMSQHQLLKQLGNQRSVHDKGRTTLGLL